MKKLIRLMVLLLVVALAACSSPGIAAEYKEYKDEGITPMYQNSMELIMMGNQMNSMLDNPQQADQYLKTEMIPMLEESKALSEDWQGRLTHEELKELNGLKDKELGLLIDSFTKLSELLELTADPGEDFEQKTAELSGEISDKQEQLEKITDEYTAKYEKLDQEYGSE
ncbi:hypothetical protein [Edaphobacillus lindanitolerans]|uniref:Cell-wall binding lipoprotein n=1 Tax=Edaphobacillus lindanitolerans TaxID=550447 RepID=A0A1U7PTA3_9BACI|nr:hypothetical protein [Edaphobacillus lindanitolerans]SIT92969.1 hypothetical protein SAMN05428946_2905 [Edaphobacillus lindanitolerans]